MVGSLIISPVTLAKKPSPDLEVDPKNPKFNIKSLVVGLVILFRPNNDNFGFCSLNLNAFGATSITNQDGSNPGNGYLQGGGYQFLVYTGASWILIGRN